MPIKIDTFYMYRLRKQRTLRLCIKAHTSKAFERAEGICRYFTLGNWSPT